MEILRENIDTHEVRFDEVQARMGSLQKELLHSDPDDVE